MRRRPLHGALLYAVAVAGILALGGGGSPLALLRALVPALRARGATTFERFFSALSPPQTPPTNRGDAATGLADAVIRAERLGRPRGLTLPGEPVPAASRDASALAASASSASFEDDVTPRPLDQDVDQGPAVADGGVRFSRLLEFRTRQDLFLACRLRDSRPPGGVKRAAAPGGRQTGGSTTIA